MAFVHTNFLNSDPNDGGLNFFNLKEALIAGSHTVVASGDGLAAFAIGSDVLTTGASGAGGFDNPLAWICLQQPPGGSGDYAGTRQIVLQRQSGGSDDTARMVYSRLGTAQTGSASSTQTVDFTDLIINVVGGGTPAAPTFDTLWRNFGTADMDIAVGDAASNFGWWLTQGNLLTPEVDTVIWMDPLSNVTPGDTDPFALAADFISTGGKGFQFDFVDNFSPSKAIFDPDSIGAGIIASSMHMQGFPGFNSAGTIISLNANHETNKDDLIKVFYVRHGLKGVSQLFHWRGVGHGYRTAYTVDSLRDKILQFRDLVPDWDGSVP